MIRVAILGSGGGGLSAATELTLNGFSCALWNRGAAAISDIIKQGSFSYRGVLGEGRVAPGLVTQDLVEALAGADVALVSLPTLAHASIATGLASAGWAGPVILNPGHTGGALEFRAVYEELGKPLPPIAEFSTLTYVARKTKPSTVNITGRAKSVRCATLPGGGAAAEMAKILYPRISHVPDVLFSSLSNVNLVLHPPGAVLGASWVEATGGSFTFYREGLSDGVARVMRRLDEERRAVGLAFGHELPALVEEMVRIGTVEEKDAGKSIRKAISGGEANATIMAPDSLGHRYYLEDFGHGLLPLAELANCAGVEVPTAAALLEIGRCLLGEELIAGGRTAQALGIRGLDREGVISIVREAA
ncbi:MAG: NAD/NADP octopine/nopaline dehydrogenase family protein [Albidovulum sp.]|nr:NAD/NADP octopine/nopaline dehydrogenase family protein [Albidovulum sp.]MDE0306612.1 NAD/NADP octopine/nopaline dehydrogenase family protein [Albidovulum sp.]